MVGIESIVLVEEAGGGGRENDHGDHCHWLKILCQHYSRFLICVRYLNSYKSLMKEVQHYFHFAAWETEV